MTSSFSCRPPGRARVGLPAEPHGEQGGRGRAVATAYTPQPSRSGRGCAPRRARPRAGHSRRWRACTAWRLSRRVVRPCAQMTRVRVGNGVASAGGPLSPRPQRCHRQGTPRERERACVLCATRSIISVLTQWGATLVIKLQSQQKKTKRERERERLPRQRSASRSARP